MLGVKNKKALGLFPNALRASNVSRYLHTLYRRP